MATRLYLVGCRHDPHAGSNRTYQVFPFILVGLAGSRAVYSFSGFEFLFPSPPFPIRTQVSVDDPVAVDPVEYFGYPRQRLSLYSIIGYPITLTLTPFPMGIL